MCVNVRIVSYTKSPLELKNHGQDTLHISSIASSDNGDPNRQLPHGKTEGFPFRASPRTQCGSLIGDGAGQTGQCSREKTKPRKREFDLRRGRSLGLFLAGETMRRVLAVPAGTYRLHGRHP